METRQREGQRPAVFCLGLDWGRFPVRTRGNDEQASSVARAGRWNCRTETKKARSVVALSRVPRGERGAPVSPPAVNQVFGTRAIRQPYGHCDLVPGGCPASCPDAHRLTHGHRHVRNWASPDIGGFGQPCKSFCAASPAESKNFFGVMPAGQNASARGRRACEATQAAKAIPLPCGQGILQAMFWQRAVRSTIRMLVFAIAAKT
jgi:hypothetical protein